MIHIYPNNFISELLEVIIMQYVVRKLYFEKSFYVLRSKRNPIKNPQKKSFTFSIFIQILK